MSYDSYLKDRTNPSYRKFQTFNLATPSDAAAFIQEWLNHHAPAGHPNPHHTIKVTVEFEPTADDSRYAKDESYFDEEYQ